MRQMTTDAFKYRFPAQTSCDFEDPTVPLGKPIRLNYESLPDIHNTRLYLAREMERLGTESIPKGAKQRIRDFVSEGAALGLSPARQYHYLLRLRLIAKVMGEHFLSPTREDIRDFLFQLTTVGYSPNTVRDIKSVIKRFYRWHFADEDKANHIVGWIRPLRSVRRDKPDCILTVDEFDRMMNVCKTLRDRTLISLLYDSGCRISEVLTLRGKDVTFDGYGAILIVSGKTGTRRVRLFGTSVPFLRKWVESRRAKQGPDAFVFANPRDGNRSPMHYHQSLQVVRRAAARAGIAKKVNPHLFRHTRATLLAEHIADAPLEIQMGWVHGSSMTRTYVHLSGKDMDRIILRAYGVEVREEAEALDNPLGKCIWCGEMSTLKSKYCPACGKEMEFKPQR